MFPVTNTGAQFRWFRSSTHGGVQKGNSAFKPPFHLDGALTAISLRPKIGQSAERASRYRKGRHASALGAPFERRHLDDCFEPAHTVAVRAPRTAIQHSARRERVESSGQCQVAERAHHPFRLKTSVFPADEVPFPGVKTSSWGEKWLDTLRVSVGSCVGALNLGKETERRRRGSGQRREGVWVITPRLVAKSPRVLPRWQAIPVKVMIRLQQVFQNQRQLGDLSGEKNGSITSEQQSDLPRPKPIRQDPNNKAISRDRSPTDRILWEMWYRPGIASLLMDDKGGKRAQICRREDAPWGQFSGVVSVRTAGTRDDVYLSPHEPQAHAMMYIYLLANDDIRGETVGRGVTARRHKATPT
ncbi:hypothetical protein Bbelb_061570 [Branchiostoma belcheri]|nr:hypothetical protein Bbelb_061570 [Branchiostoma belcheri]